VPRSLPWAAVCTLLATPDRATVAGRRDYAILVLLAAYGLRACEVAALALDDIDWRGSRLRIPRAKGRAPSWYPLHPDAGAALVDYLRRGRPDSAYGQIFLTLSAPARPFARSSGISNIVARHLQRAGIAAPHWGAHTLRHSRAVHLLRGWLLADRDRRSVRPRPPPVDLRLREGGPRRPAGGRARDHGSPLVTAPFVSGLGPQLAAYLEVMRAVGRRYERVEAILRNLDRFAAAELAGGQSPWFWPAVAGPARAPMRRSPSSRRPLGRPAVRPANPTRRVTSRPGQQDSPITYEYGDPCARRLR
jgi:hypothetical protein